MSYLDRDKLGMYKDSADAGPGPQLMGADTLIGDSVVNGAEENLGQIKDLMLNMNTGQVAYAVLAFGGFLHMGEKLFAVPWPALHLDTVNKRFVLNVEKERLKNAPGFNPDNWPNMNDIAWANQVHTFYGTDAARQGAPTMGPGSSVATGGVIGGAGTGPGMGAGMAGSDTAGSGVGLSSGSGGSTTGTGGGAMGTGSEGGTGGNIGLGAGTSRGASDLGSTTAGGGGSRTS
ncbi:PRC-barrel domain-containing protein [Massilia horti]|uniref:PRC-barrel domain containing protein n=1 Tax=Massilia horti TaxID=2562153 RepID=A0A4Y9T606_9BURK|nr:PRC-barrel domain-containing protein [Massilia horti]TFW36197.1 PRC-barrel domain containing protein [Massilia horti]